MLDEGTNVQLERLDEEAGWAQRVRQGNKEALTQLYDRYVDRVYRYFCRRIKKVSEAELLTARTFTRAVEVVRTGRPGGLQDKPFSFLLSRIADEVLQERERELNGASLVGELNDVPEHFEAMLQGGTMVDSHIWNEEDAIWLLVRELQVVEQRLLIMRHAHNLPYVEIARYLKCNETVCAELHFRILNKLKLLAQEAGLWSKITDG
jgi:RNA polymerase sigma-70 factor (ECF subfamily)